MDRDDKRRYFIVGSVIMEVVTPLFRTRLERDYTSKGLTTLQAFLNTQPVIHILFHLRHRNARCCVDGQNCYNHTSLPLIHCQWKRLYTEKPGLALHDCHCKFTANPVQLEDLDITLSSLFLLNCNNLTPAEDAAVQSLRQYKNDYLSHNTTGRISHTEYNSLWTDLKNFVLQLDPNKQDDLIRIEQRPLDEALCNSYTLNLLDLHKKLDEMDNSIQGIRSDIQGQNAYMQEILLYIRKDGCSCQCGNSEQQNKDHTNNKQYTLGQDVFKFHHQISQTSEICNGLKKLYQICYTDDRHHTLTLPSTPWRMTTLQDGSLYVVCEDGSVQHVSSDGKHYKPVTTKGLQKLKYIAYNKMQRQLVTMNMNQNIINDFYEI
ncbi:unnamed protein product [Mytilus edulis]|uniref:DZIP3-like HEPN domain-containing protein n=1 Tax=Mytilus edulis TaxID=6550 RepID=A0A8S3RG70_MYTED|nr:unnamed protein product [Mytilus edulis]